MYFAMRGPRATILHYCCLPYVHMYVNIYSVSLSVLQETRLF